jgi:hypothetical protein
MKHIKRVLAALLAFLLASGIAAPAAQALDNTVHINQYGNFNGLFEYRLSDGTWKALNVPIWRIEETGAISFCLQSDLDSPHGEAYTQFNPSAFANATVLNGIRAIVLNGYPNNNGGLEDYEAFYATQRGLRDFQRQHPGGYHHHGQRRQSHQSSPEPRKLHRPAAPIRTEA